ncbi:MAG: hypothetical protein B6245_11440, partial [Desulfobacteraceae bacterium 4572_88]
MINAKYKTGLVFFPAFDWAISPTHPEREERLLYTQDQVSEEGLFDIEGITEFKPDLVLVQDIRRVHFCVPDVWDVTTESHFISAGGAKTIGMAVMDKQVDRGFALVRPPGHHAMRMVHGARGFCNINIEAVMIEFLRTAYGVDRVAIVDTDCHHGDGTQDIYWHDPDDMNFSAQGYAELTALLKPDIAVLEGGYAIEGALPYVNLGIILAMAGIDYSQVREPGYDP